MKAGIDADSRRLAVVVRDSNDAITVQDLQGNIMAWNKGAEKMYGYTEAEALGMNIAQILAPETKKEAMTYLERIASGKAVESLETQRVCRDGSVLDVWLERFKVEVRYIHTSETILLRPAVLPFSEPSQSLGATLFRCVPWWPASTS